MMTEEKKKELWSRLVAEIEDAMTGLGLGGKRPETVVQNREAVAFPSG